MDVRRATEIPDERRPFQPPVVPLAVVADVAFAIKGQAALIQAALSLQAFERFFLITADAPLVKPANLVMRYSDLVPAPSFVYLAVGANGPWKSIGGTEGQPFTIQTTTLQLGYFAAGYPAGATSRSRSGSSQLLPIAVAVLILGVVVAGIPLTIVRRRRAAGGVEKEAEDEEE